MKPTKRTMGVAVAFLILSVISIVLMPLTMYFDWEPVLGFTLWPAAVLFFSVALVMLIVGPRKT